MQIVDAGIAILDAHRKTLQRSGIDNAADVLVEENQHLEVGIRRREVVDLFALLVGEDGVDHIGAAGLHHLLRLGPIHCLQINADVVAGLP